VALRVPGVEVQDEALAVRYRVKGDGTLRLDGRISFGALRRAKSGLHLEYTQSVPGYNTYGPLTATATRPRTGQLQLEMAVYNPGASGNFKFATFNERGTSKPSKRYLYLVGAQAAQ
jgi:hypothetical protein